MGSYNFKLNELRELKKSILNLKREYLEIDDSNDIFKRNVETIIEFLDKIYEEVFVDINQTNKIKNYGDLYLPMVISLIDKYNSLKKKKVSTSDVREFYKRVEDMVVVLLNHFSKKYDSIIDDSIMVNDAELKALLKSIK